MGSTEPEVLLVHRPRWADWSFPKGKLNRGEASYAATIREVKEETGLTVTLGPRLPSTNYTVTGGQPKVVDYWCARPPMDADITMYRANAEIDLVRWVPASQAMGILSYPYDADLLETFAETAYDTVPLLVVRHADARSRKSWRGDDSERPLSAEGRGEAQRLILLLNAFGIRRTISSDALRCVDTVLPYLHAHPGRLRLDPSLSEEGFDSEAMKFRVRKALEGTKRVAICSHRPVLPQIQQALGIEPVALEPGALLALHRRDGKVQSVEHYPPP